MNPYTFEIVKKAIYTFCRINESLLNQGGI